jgi:pimeloyl-ACP methyl ester carboxylesterase
MSNPIIYYISGLLPGIFTKVAYQKLTHPQIRKLRDHELDILAKARQADMDFKGGTIRTYHWGEVGEPVLLIHGWEGQAGNFADIIPALLEAGCQVHAFDGPSHGFSSIKPTSLFDFIALVAQRIEQLGVKRLISHSFGGVATTYALSQNPQISIDRYVLLTAPDRFRERIDYVFAQAGLHPKVKTRLIRQLEEDWQVKVDQLNVSRFVETVQVKKALILQDKDDRVVPLEQSRRVHEAWPESDLQIVDHTGHFRNLRDASVIKMVGQFLSTGAG